MDYGLVWDVTLATLSGFVVAFAVFWLLSNQPYSLRLIDLVSFFLGFLALIGGLLTSYRYHLDQLQSVDRLWESASVVDIGFDAGIDIMRLCERVRHTPYRPPASKRAECRKLDEYLGRLKYDRAIPTRLKLPNVADYSDSDVRKIAERVYERVNEANKQISDYERDRLTHYKITALEALARELSLPVLAFAFGLGVGRRTIDLYLALPPPLQQPLKKVLRSLRRMFRRVRRALTRRREGFRQTKAAAPG